MKVVLLKYVQTLGNAGEVCTVSDGHARNFLFPKGFAAPVTTQALAHVARMQEKREKAAIADLTEVEELAGKLDGYALTLSAKANKSGTLFAAVTKKAIVDAVRKAGFDITEKNIALAAPIKDLGEHEVPLVLPHKLEVSIHVSITAK